MQPYNDISGPDVFLDIYRGAPVKLRLYAIQLASEYLGEESGAAFFKEVKNDPSPRVRRYAEESRAWHADKWATLNRSPFPLETIYGPNRIGTQSRNRKMARSLASEAGPLNP